MEPVKKNIKVTRTARYFVLGNDTQHVRNILIVLHGYGMNAEVFLSNFKQLVNVETMVIAPEGLSRFYRKGFTGDVVASWMTKEDRLDEIEDYIALLDAVYDQVTQISGAKVFVLGFSQGATTASRWVMNSNRSFNGLIIWSGEFASEVLGNHHKLNSIYNIIGDEDEFITLDKFKNQTQVLENKGFDIAEVIFKGKHVIEHDTLNSVWQNVLNQN